MPGHSNAKKSGPSGSLFCILGTSSTGDESGVSITQGVVVSAFAGSFRAEEEPRCFVTAFSIGKICATFMRFSMQRTNYALSAFRDRKYVHLEDNADQSAVREAFDAIRLKWGLFFRPSKAFLGKGGRLVLFAGTLLCRLEKAEAT